MKKNFEAYKRELADRLLTSNGPFAVRKTGGIMDCIGNPKHREGIFGLICCNKCIFQKSLDGCIAARRNWLVENYEGEIEIGNDRDRDWNWCPIGMPLLVRNQRDEPWKKGYFVEYKNGKIYACPHITTSEYSYAEGWNYAKIRS